MMKIRKENSRHNLSHLLRLGLFTMLMLGIASTSQAGVIALNSSLDVVAQAGRDSHLVLDTASDSQGASTNTLGLISANATSISAAGTLITTGSAIATWSNTASGQVRFEDVGWDNSEFALVSNSSLAGTQWAYNFIADVSGFFSIDWTVSLQQAASESFGLQDFRFSLAGAGGGQTVMGVDSSGSATRNIIAGNEYTAFITTNPGIFGGVGGRTSFMDGVFDWSMDSGPTSSVSEPSSMALLGLGLLAIRATNRRRLSKCRAI